MSNINSEIHACGFFEPNYTSIGGAITCTAILVTALVVSILGTYTHYLPYHGAWAPTLYTSIGLLVLDVGYILSLIVNRTSKKEERQPKQAQAHMPQPSVHIAPPPDKAACIYDHPKKPIDPMLFGLRCESGRKFPKVPEDKKQEVVNEAVAGLKNIESEKIPEQFAPYLSAIKYTQATGMSNSVTKDRFFPIGDVLQTPIRLSHDEFFESREYKNYFFMHSSVAPKWKHYKSKELQYFDDMEEGYYLTIKAQVLSKAEHVLSNYWGMGAFIRKAFQGEEMIKFRRQIAKRLVKAYCRVIDENRAEQFTFYLGGPTGVSLPPEFEAEPRENYDAFVLGFSECGPQYTKNVILCPETDIFVKAQEISDTYTCKEGEMAPVSALNASDPHRLGNHWHTFKKEGQSPNAEFAIEENVFRRSPSSAWIARELNRQETSSKPVNLLTSLNHHLKFNQL